jgi:hypothetical protein
LRYSVTGPGEAAVADQHSRVVAEAASAALSPLGLVREGRSRIWLDDQSWWVGVAEVQAIEPQARCLPERRPDVPAGPPKIPPDFARG